MFIYVFIYFSSTLKRKIIYCIFTIHNEITPSEIILIYCSKSISYYYNNFWRNFTSQKSFVHYKCLCQFDWSKKCILAE